MDMSSLLGDAAPTKQFLTAVVSDIAGHPVAIATAAGEPVPYDSGSPATACLARLRGTTTDGTAWSVFVKVLQHPRHWPGLDRIPPPRRQEFCEQFPWRTELGAWDPAFTDRLPPGLRVPVLYRLAELPGDRLALWMEDVTVDDRPWTTPRFLHAARLLGAFAANRSDPDLLASSPHPPGYGLRRYYDGPVQYALKAIQDPRTWTHPALRRHTALRNDLLDLASRSPRILKSLNDLPQSMGHGDASPQNLLIPADDPATIVAIDIAFPSPQAVGFDLGQLLIGLAHAGQLPVAALPGIHAGLAPAYAEGMRAGRHPATEADVYRGYVGSLTIRAAFTALPIHELGPASQDMIDQRADLTRFILDTSRGLDW